MRRRETYLAFAAFLLTISPDIHANLRWSQSGLGANYADHLSRIGDVGLNRHYMLFFGRDAAALPAGPVLSRQRGRRRAAVLTWVGLAALYAGGTVFGKWLGLEPVAAAAVPEVLWPADGRSVTVRVFFHACAVCRPAAEAELVEVRVDGEATAVGFEGADLGTDDRTFRV